MAPGNCSWAKFPDPFRAISHDHFLLRPGPNLAAGALAVQAGGEKLFGRFDRSRIGGAVFVSHRPAFGIPLGLCEDTAELDLPGVCARPLLPLPVRPSSSLLTMGTTRAIHLHIHHRDRLAYRDGQLSLPGLLDGVLLAAGRYPRRCFSVVRSTALVVTSSPANSFICSRPRSKEEHSLPHQSQACGAPPVESSVFSTSSAVVGGELPLLTARAPVIRRAAFFGGGRAR